MTKIIALSKDGFEKEIDRVQSKLNLFYFLKSHDNDILLQKTYEERYWHLATQKTEQKIDNKYEKFLVDQANEVDENFAYEGLFDQENKKNLKKIGTGIDRSRIDVSHIMGPLSKSRIIDEQNFSNILNKTNKNSMNSFSKNSEYSGNMQIIRKVNFSRQNKRSSLFVSRNSLRSSSNFAANSTHQRNGAKSRSLANIFSIGPIKETTFRNTFNSDSFHHRGSFASGNSSKAISELIHGNVTSIDTYKFKKKLEEAKNYESRINLYDTNKNSTKRMSHLEIPETTNLAFPNTMYSQENAQTTDNNKLSMNYNRNEYLNTKDVDKSENL